MKLSIQYIGTLNGVKVSTFDFIPEGMNVIETKEIYYPSENKIFSKGGELFEFVVKTQNVNMEDYEEIEIPEGEDETTTDYNI